MLEPPAMSHSAVGKRARMLWHCCKMTDSALTFGPHLHRVVIVARNQFLEVLHCAESAGFSPFVAAAQTTSRVEPAILFSAALLATAPGAIQQLNSLQHFWAGKLLGIPATCNIAYSLAVAQCGWERRLAAKTLEAAAVAFARLSILPENHPAARMLALVPTHGVPPVLLELRRRLAASVEGGLPVPSLEEAGFAPELLASARSRKWDRRD